LAAPLFSIIVPTLDVEAALGACLDSIAAQTFADYQVVVVDGGSTDRTLEILAAAAPALGARLVAHRGQDQGVYDAMNRGVALATGRWLLFLGADDRLHAPETLAEVAALLDAVDDCQLAHGDVVLRSSGARYGGACDLDRLLFEENLCHQSVFYRRDLFSSIGPYNLRYRIWADWDFNIRCFANPALPTRHLDVIVADYDDTGGLSQQNDPELRQRLPVFLLADRPPTFGEKLADLIRKLLRLPRQDPRRRRPR